MPPSTYLVQYQLECDAAFVLRAGSRVSRWEAVPQRSAAAGCQLRRFVQLGASCLSCPNLSTAVAAHSTHRVRSHPGLQQQEPLLALGLRKRRQDGMAGCQSRWERQVPHVRYEMRVRLPVKHQHWLCHWDWLVPRGNSTIKYNKIPIHRSLLYYMA